MRYPIALLALSLAFSCADTSKSTESDSDPLQSMPNLSATLEYEIDSMLGEGAFWDDRKQRLFWVDIEGKRLHIYDPVAKHNRSLPTPTRIGTVVPKNDTTAIVALEDGIYLMELHDGGLTQLSDVESDIVDNRFNDGKCDPNGNLWVGSMRMDETEATAALYRISPDGTTSKMLEDITISNGIVWTKDAKKMYYIDTPTGIVRSFDYDTATAEISNEQEAIEIPASLGYPDGMAIDEEDMVWIALWNGNAVGRFDPRTGRLLQTITVPAHNVTSCAFGGPDLDILYITTASIDMNETEKRNFPYAGSLFSIKPGVKGVKGNFFGSK